MSVKLIRKKIIIAPIVLIVLFSVAGYLYFDGKKTENNSSQNAQIVDPNNVTDEAPLPSFEGAPDTCSLIAKNIVVSAIGSGAVKSEGVKTKTSSGFLIECKYTKTPNKIVSLRVLQYVNSDEARNDAPNQQLADRVTKTKNNYIISAQVYDGKNIDTQSAEKIVNSAMEKL